MTAPSREQLNIVIVGHVDHGKSTLVGRLLADTDSLPDGKIEFVRNICERQGKEFEYAFLLDALEAEQDQGITIDSARCFFKTDARDYIIIDAPGHIEFLKNMISGAARAEAAVLLIDAKEGVRENSRRHGYMLSLLGIRQVVVAVNKMDLVDHDQAVFDAIEAEYREFLGQFGVTPRQFIPISARNGDFVATGSGAMNWYDGPTVLQAVDAFPKATPPEDLPLRLPVQDVYKFNAQGDDRRIVAGRIESGEVKVGDRVFFWPSGKSSEVASIEAFNVEPPPERAAAGESTGVTLREQIFVTRGEIMSHQARAPKVSSLLRASLFWMGREAMRPGRNYKLKLGTAQMPVEIHELLGVIDAGEGGAEATTGKAADQVGRHECAELVLRCYNPVAFDISAEVESTGRFVIVDGYDVAGGGIIREALDDGQSELRAEAMARDIAWQRGLINRNIRAERNGHGASLVLFSGEAGVGKAAIARELEARIFQTEHQVYLLDGQNVLLGIEADLQTQAQGAEMVRRFGEVAYLMLDAGLIVISTTNTFGLADHGSVRTLVSPNPVLNVHVGPEDAPPLGTDLHFQTAVVEGDAVHAAVDDIEALMRERGLLSR